MGTCVRKPVKSVQDPNRLAVSIESLNLPVQRPMLGGSLAQWRGRLQWLKPQDLLALLWLVVTIPFGFLELSIKRRASILIVRLIFIPLILTLRPLLVDWSNASSGERERDRSDKKASAAPSGGVWQRFVRLVSQPPRSGRCATLLPLILYVIAVALPMLIYPIGYGEVGLFIDLMHDEYECHNDAAVKDFEQDWFDSQPAYEWRGRSRSAAHMAWLEYLQFCYFTLYVVVALTPLFLYLRYRRRSRGGSGSGSGVTSSPPSPSMAGITASQSREALQQAAQAPDRPASPTGQSDAGSSSSSSSSSSSDGSGGDVGPSSSSHSHSHARCHGWALCGCDVCRERWLAQALADSNAGFAFDASVVSLLVASYACWAIYLNFPVAGPLWCFPRPRPEDVGVFFSFVNLSLQDSGASKGTAFPSSHCAATMTLWIIAMIYHKRMAVVMMGCVPGLVLSTVYLQYHYLIDAIVGTLMGCLLPFIAIRVTRSIALLFDLKQQEGHAIVPYVPRDLAHAAGIARKRKHSGAYTNGKPPLPLLALPQEVEGEEEEERRDLEGGMADRDRDRAAEAAPAEGERRERERERERDVFSASVGVTSQSLASQRPPAFFGSSSMSVSGVLSPRHSSSGISHSHSQSHLPHMALASTSAYGCAVATTAAHMTHGTGLPLGANALPDPHR